jgi:hypothetical protein
VTRKDIGKAYTAFVKNEAKTLPSAAGFAQLLYDGPIPFPGAPSPPIVDKQFFGISDPNDFLGALTGNYSDGTTNPLASYWDSTLMSFFTVGNYLSINLSAGSPDNYSGTCSQQTNPITGVASPAFTLAGPSGTFTFYMPLAAGAEKPGITGAQYVFQQSFGVGLTPAGSGGDAGLLQDAIWQALCRGVAVSGVSTKPITNGESTTAWNNPATWYQAGAVSHVYAKFLHYSAIDGSDSRLSGKHAIYFGQAAYGFSEDENPNGPYTGPNVPSKTPGNVPDGSTVKVIVGPWDGMPA